MPGVLDPGSRSAAARIELGSLLGGIARRQSERVEGRVVAPDHAAQPEVDGEDEVAQRLDDGPLAVDLFVAPGLREALGSAEGLGPARGHGVPSSAVVVGRHEAPQGDPLGEAPVELVADVRRHVDALDADAPELAAEGPQVDVVEHRSAHPQSAQVALPEGRVLMVGADVEVLGQLQVHAEESHTSSVPSRRLQVSTRWM